ncbi:MAG: type B 50S ribosomal protein L31 [Planctomycetota bacterium]
MKSDIHPNYRPVVFRDVSSGTNFLTRSTIKTEDTITLDDGAEYPMVKVNVSSASHPFYTGQAQMLDTAGRVEKFRRRYKR